ncbi:MAG: DUF2062 domain-containing protein [Bdellovibrio sp.]
MKKPLQLVYDQLRQGVSAHELALTVALGASLGLLPMFGVTTIFCLLVAAVLRLNQPILQVVNYSMTPLHLLMIPVFLRTGESLLGVRPISFSVEKMGTDFGQDPLAFIQDYSWAAVHAVFAWGLIAPLIGFALYFILKPIFLKLGARIHPSL